MGKQIREGASHLLSLFSLLGTPLPHTHGWRPMCQTWYLVLCGIISFSPQDNPLRSLAPFSWLRKLKCRYIKEISQSHRGGKWQSWDQTDAVPFQRRTLKHHSHVSSRDLSLFTPLWQPGPNPSAVPQCGLMFWVMSPSEPAERPRGILRGDSQCPGKWLWDAQNPRSPIPS